MRTPWHWGLGMVGILLAHTARAEPGETAAPVSGASVQARSSFAPHIVISEREARLGLVGSF